jgi:L-rhamnose mutarotase
MQNIIRFGSVALAVGVVAFCCGFTANRPRELQRIGKVIGIKPEKIAEIKPEKIAEYKRLHTGDNCVVRDLLEKYHLHNFSIYLHKIDGKWYEFAYCEYDGEDIKSDMAKLSAEPRNIKWMETCNAMQIPLKGETSWAVMEQVFHNP